MYDARLRLGDIEYREGRPYIGVQAGPRLLFIWGTSRTKDPLGPNLGGSVVGTTKTIQTMQNKILASNDVKYQFLVNLCLLVPQKL